MNMDTKEAYPRVHIRETSVLQKYLSLLTFETVHTYTLHTYTLLMLPKWAFQLNRIKKIQIYKLIENVNTIIL